MVPVFEEILKIKERGNGRGVRIRSEWGSRHGIVMLWYGRMRREGTKKGLLKRRRGKEKVVVVWMGRVIKRARGGKPGKEPRDGV